MKRGIQYLPKAVQRGILAGAVALGGGFGLETIAQEPEQTQQTTTQENNRCLITIVKPDTINEGKIHHGVEALREEKDKYIMGEDAYGQIVESTPEYKQIKEEKIARGTGKYWILMSKASERTMRAIVGYAKQNNFEVFVSEDYTPALNPNPDVPNHTKEIIDYMKKVA